MSDDLISRKALYQELARLEELARNRVLDTPTSSPCYARYNAQLNERTNLKHIIADASVAYDADKVIERIEKNIADAQKVIVKPNDKLDEIANDTAEAFISAYETTIEIVKGGGIND